MLTVDPAKRFSIIDIMNHKWVKYDNELELFSNQVNFSLNFDENDFADSLKIGYFFWLQLLMFNEWMGIWNVCFLFISSETTTKKHLTDKNVLNELEKYNLNIEDIAKVNLYIFLLVNNCDAKKH